MDVNKKDKIRLGSPRKFWFKSAFACFLFFAIYFGYINSFELSYRNLADSLIWSIVVLSPLIHDIWSVYVRGGIFAYSLFARMLGVYFFSLVISLVLTISYCEGEECLSTVGLAVLASFYNFVLSLVFLYLNRLRRRKAAATLLNDRSGF